jgi:hypothetical protein
MKGIHVVLSRFTAALVIAAAALAAAGRWG